MAVVSGNGASETAVPVAALTPAQEWLGRMRAWLLVVAAVVAHVAYKAGLHPPGGNRALPHDLTAFHLANTTAFVGSMLTIVLLLLNEDFYKSEAKLRAVASTATAGLGGLLGACVVAARRDPLYAFFLIVPTCFVFSFVVYIFTELLQLNLKGTVEGARKREGAEKIRRGRSSGRASAV